MHYLTYVVVESYETAYEECQKKLDLYKEQQGTECPYDWYQIGGRWQGYFDKEYDPEKDTRNYIACVYCRLQTVLPCNQCNGTEKTLVWPSNWVDHREGNIKKIGNLDEMGQPSAIMAGVFLDDYLFRDGKWNDVVISFLRSNIDKYVVVVDCHC